MSAACPNCGWVGQPAGTDQSHVMYVYVNKANPEITCKMQSSEKEIVHKGKAEGGKDIVWVRKDVHQQGAMKAANEVAAKVVTAEANKPAPAAVTAPIVKPVVPAPVAPSK